MLTVKKKKEQKKEISYPCVGVSNQNSNTKNLIVLFFSPQTGNVINSPENVNIHPVGYFSDSWVMGFFDLFDVEISY